MNFAAKLAQASQKNRSLLCVGLDPDLSLLPHQDVPGFLCEMVDATADQVCAYKPNLAFFEALGREGLRALEQVVAHIPKGLPVIGDGKRGDIGHTSRAYAHALFEVFGFDAITVSPYLGHDGVEPFLAYQERGVFLLCRTSNPGARDFQDLLCVPKEASTQPARPLYEVVAEKARTWNRHGNLGLVVGATYPEELGRLRQLCPDMLFLIPGVGTQGGDLEEVVRRGVNAQGGGAIINVSRQVLYASRGADFAAAARAAAQALRERIERCRISLSR